MFAFFFNVPLNLLLFHESVIVLSFCPVTANKHKFKVNEEGDKREELISELSVSLCKTPGGILPFDLHNPH